MKILISIFVIALAAGLIAAIAIGLVGIVANEIKTNLDAPGAREVFIVETGKTPLYETPLAGPADVPTCLAYEGESLTIFGTYPEDFFQPTELGPMVRVRGEQCVGWTPLQNLGKASK